MRKVLLASTALVALGSVSAMAADVTISGTSEGYYKSYDKNGGFAGAANGTSMSLTNNVDFSFSQTTDSGLTMNLAVGLSGAGNVDDEKLSISGDFGTIRLSNDQEGVGDAAINGGAQTNDETTSLTAGLGKYGTSMATGAMITYYTPSMSGLSAGVSFADAGTATRSDVTEMRVAYTTMMDDTSVTIDYVSSSTDDNGTAGATSGSDATSMGIAVSMGAMAFSGNVATKSDNSNTYDYQSTSIGASYVLGNGMKVGVYQNNGDNDKDAKYEWEQTAASIDYTIAPGLSTGITLTDTSMKANTTGTKTNDDYTVIHLTAKF